MKARCVHQHSVGAGVAAKLRRLDIRNAAGDAGFGELMELTVDELDH